MRKKKKKIDEKLEYLCDNLNTSVKLSKWIEGSFLMDNNSLSISFLINGNKLSSTKLIISFIFSVLGKYTCCMNKLVLYVS